VLECGNILGGGGDVFSRYIRYEVGDGSKIRFGMMLGVGISH
jgi:hypothetical protein